jgi:hypothetical protein
MFRYPVEPWFDLQAELKDLKLELFDETQATRDDTRNETRDKFTVALVGISRPTYFA